MNQSTQKSTGRRNFFGIFQILLVLLIMGGTLFVAAGIANHLKVRRLRSEGNIIVDLPIHDLPVPKADRRAPVGTLPLDWQIQSIFSHNIFSNVAEGLGTHGTAYDIELYFNLPKSS